MKLISILQQWFTTNERILMPLSLVLGFIVDALTLRRVDLLPETILLYSYLGGIGLSIIFMHLIEEGVFRGNLARILKPFLPLVTQFIFGSLFSAFLIFYARSSSLAASWPFLLILLFIFVGTEIFKRYQQRLAFQLCLYFFGIFGFAIFAVPLAVGDIGSEVFLMSGAAAIVVFGLFFIVMLLLGPNRLKQSIRATLVGVFIIYCTINLLYFLHVLPPVPLILKDIGIYHNVVKNGDSYQLSQEVQMWYERFFTHPTVHLVEGEPAFAFSSVFTPVAIRTNIVHRWEYWSELQNKWVTENTVSFQVSGGRDGGYRGFSFKRGVFPGLWRVSVETPDGNLIGRQDFYIEFVTQIPNLKTISE